MFCTELSYRIFDCIFVCFELCFRAEIAGFVDAAMGNAPCRATAEDGVWLMKILDAIYASAKTGKSVDITPIA